LSEESGKLKLGYVSSIVKHDVLVKSEIGLGEYVKKIAGIGYDSCGIFSCRGQAGYPTYLSVKDRQELKKLLHDLGCDVAGIGAYGGMMLTTEFAYLVDDAERKYAVDFMKKSVDLAVDLDCEVVEDLAGVKPEGMSENKAWTSLCAWVREICDYAGERGVFLAVEHLGLVDTPAKFLELVEAVGSEALKCVYDPSNMLKYLGQRKKEILEGIRLNGEYIADVHLKGVSKDLEFVRPCSDEDYYGQREFLEALKEVGYRGSVLVEEYEQFYAPSTAKEPFLAARLAYADMRKILEGP
jgi:sugar phosphate isomerase/epimerase